MNEFQCVRDFMLAMEQEVPPSPRIPDRHVLALRVQLVAEEVNELFSAFERIRPDLTEPEKLGILVDVADAVADINYVVNGTAVAFGIDGTQVFEIVHAANMRKASGPTSVEGKKLKPSGWVGPELEIRNMLQSARMNYQPVVEQVAGVEWEGPQT